MDVVIGIAILAAIFGGVLLWDKAKGAAVTKLNQSVFSRGKHARGSAAVETALLIDSARPATIVLTETLAALDAPTARPKVRPALYFAGREDSKLVWHFGSAIQTLFVAELGFIDEVDSPGSSGAYQVTNYTLADGIVAGLEQMEKLAADIRRAILAADPAATLEEARPTDRRDPHARV